MDKNFKKSKLSQLISRGLGVCFTLPILYSQVIHAEGLQLEEVVVTAEKKTASLQDTAISVSAFSGGMLEDMGIDDVQDLYSHVPNLNVGNFGESVVINIRGIQSNNTAESGDPGVAFHIDGIYQARPRGAGALFYDIERIEVLRGPQGTLYGRNATAGALNVITNKPKDEFEASLEFLIGNYDRRTAKGVLNLPVVEDKFALRAAFYTNKHDGYGENDRVVSSIDNSDDADEQSLRLQALINPTDDLSILLSGSYYQTDSAGSHWVNIGIPESSDVRQHALNTQPVFDADNWRISTEINWDLNDDWTVTYVGAYQEDTVDERTKDMDGTMTLGILPPSVPPVATFGPFTSKAEQLSHELRFGWNDPEGRWEWLGGLYYFDEEQQVTLDVTFVPGLFSLFFDQKSIESTSKAAFTDLKFNLTEEVQLVGGLRYTDDEKSRVGSTTTVNLVGAPFPPGTTPNIGETESTSTDWRLGVNWRPDPDSLYYFVTGTGYKQGGFNDGIDLTGYDPEEVMSYELGSKNEFMDNRLRLNTSLFLMDYTDLQVSSVQVGGGGLGLRTGNAAEATIWGVELEGMALITEELQLDFSVGYLNAEYDEFQSCDPFSSVCSGPTAVNADLSGNQLTKSPEWTFNLGLQYRFNLEAGGSLTPRIQFHYEDEHYLREFNTSIDEQESFTKTDVSLAYRTPSEKLLVEVFVNNLEDEDVLTNAINLPNGLVSHVAPPRTYGMRVAYDWD